MIKSLYNILARAVWLVHLQQHSTALQEGKRNNSNKATNTEHSSSSSCSSFFFLISYQRVHHPVRVCVCVCAGAYITVRLDDDERIKGESTSGRKGWREEKVSAT